MQAMGTQQWMLVRTVRHAAVVCQIGKEFSHRFESSFIDDESASCREANKPACTNSFK